MVNKHNSARSANALERWSHKSVQMTRHDQHCYVWDWDWANEQVRDAICCVISLVDASCSIKCAVFPSFGTTKPIVVLAVVCPIILRPEHTNTPTGRNARLVCTRRQSSGDGGGNESKYSWLFNHSFEWRKTLQVEIERNDLEMAWWRCCFHCTLHTFIEMQTMEELAIACTQRNCPFHLSVSFETLYC